MTVCFALQKLEFNVWRAKQTVIFTILSSILLQVESQAEVLVKILPAFLQRVRQHVCW